MNGLKQTDAFKRLSAAMKDVNGDSSQILRNVLRKQDYLLEKVSILKELLETATGRKQPEFTNEQKRRLAHRGKELNEYLLGAIEHTYAPSTIFDWYRELIGKKYDGTGRPGQKRRGRKTVSPEIIEKVLDFQSRNPDWGYERIAETMRYSHYDVCATTVRKILDDHGIVPTPERRTRGDWMQFITTQQYLAASTDFMTVELLTPVSLERRHVLFFMDIGTREVVCGGIAHDPDGNWTTQIARNQCDIWDGFLLGKKYLIHDRDSLFGKRFDAVCESIWITVKRTPPFHPDMNAFMEAFIKSTRTECFDRIIFTSEAQLRYAAKSWLDYYNHYRCHRSLDGGIINPLPQDDEGEIVEVSFLGGLLHEYRREKKAA